MGGDQGFMSWTYSGVDHSLPGNGGIECRDFLGLSQRCWESAIASLVALTALVVAYPRVSLPELNRCCRVEPPGKRILLLVMCLTFGIEIGFKLATRQMIWIGNPCHIATMLQLFILAAPPSRFVTAAFRLHMHMLTGAPLAILFPVINTRLLPGETEVYFLQHILMLVIPFYLMSIGDPFITEDLLDFNWAMISFGLLFLYHFLPLQMLAYFSHVNLNNMLCPAVSDPFHGKYYRLFAIGHQLILIPFQGKLLVVIARAFGLVSKECTTHRECCIYNEKNKSSNSSFVNNSCLSPSMADQTKSSDVYEDSGFLGTGCALDGAGNVQVNSEMVLNRADPLGEVSFRRPRSPLKMNYVKRLVNGELVEGEAETSHFLESMTGNGATPVLSELGTNRNGHAKCH